MIKSDDKGYYYEDMLGFRHYYNPQTDYPENDIDVTQTAVPPNEWKKYTTGVTSTNNVTKIEFQDLPQTAAPGKYSKASITKQILAHERVMRAIKQGLKVIFRRDNIINDKRVTEEKILNPGKKGMPEYIVRFTGKINADGSLINDEWITFRYPALPGDKEKKEEEEKVTAGSGAPIGGGVDNGPSGGGSGGGGGGSNGPSGDEDGYTGGPTDDIKGKYLLKPWLAKLPETEEEVVVSDTRQPDDYPGDDLIDIFDEQEARRSHGPNPFYPKAYSDAIFPPPPPEASYDIKALYAYFLNEVMRYYSDDAGMLSSFQDGWNRILEIAGIKKLEGSKIIVTKDITVNGVVENDTNPNLKLEITQGNLKWAASNLDRFTVFLSLMGHEYIHRLQNADLHVPTHEEKETIAHLFNLWPNDTLDWIRRNFPDKFKQNYRYNYPAPDAPNVRIFHLTEFFRYYDALTPEIQAKYFSFFQRAKVLFFRLLVLVRLLDKRLSLKVVKGIENSLRILRK